jgi:hypothetical protein
MDRCYSSERILPKARQNQTPWHSVPAGKSTPGKGDYPMNSILPLLHFDWSATIGKVVEMVCFSEFSVYLHLEDLLLLQIEAEFSFGKTETNSQSLCSFPIVNSELPSLVGSKVINATLQDGMLELLFSNRLSVSVFTAGPYEAVQVSYRGQRFVGW